MHPDKLVSKGDSTQSAIKILNAAYKALRDKPKGDQYVSCSRGSFPCSRCGGRHVVIKTDRNPMLGRYCRFCDRYHKVYDGEAWIEGSIWAKDFYFCKTDGVVGPQVRTKSLYSVYIYCFVFRPFQTVTVNYRLSAQDSNKRPFSNKRPGREKYFSQAPRSK